MNRGCFTSTISRRVFSLLGIVLSVVLTISLVSTYNKTLPTINAAVQLECSGLPTPQVSLENQRDANGVPHQTKCVDPATGKISLPWASTVTGTTPTVVAKLDLVSQTANPNTGLPITLYTVPATAQGRYRASCYFVLTTAAATSSTLPICAINWNDAETNQVAGGTWNNAASSNILGTITVPATFASLVFMAKAGTPITTQITGYVSNPASTMAYSIHINVEYLGQ